MKDNVFKWLMLLATVLLLLPMVAMFFTNEVRWSWGDFAVAAFLLFGQVFLADWIWARLNSLRDRLLVIGAILILLLALWLELAVGIVGSPLAGS